MNYIKTIISISEYKEVIPLGSKYILHILPEKTEDDSYICVETMLNHEPTAAEIAEITADAEAYFNELERNAKKRETQQEIKELKQKLADTDYEAIKYAEGWIDNEDYAPIKAKRQTWRDRINELELLIEISK